MPHTTPNDSCPTPKATPIDASRIGLPPAQGLYHPKNEHDACGVGFVAHIKGRKATPSSSRA